MSLKSQIENNFYVLPCNYCEQNIYEYTGTQPIDPNVPILAKDLTPTDESIPPAESGKPLNCPFCSSTLIPMV